MPLEEVLRAISSDVERPEAMDDSDPEPGFQERTVPTAPGSMLRHLASQPSDVVTAVVLDDEQPAVRPEHPLGLGQLMRVDATERRPGCDDRIGRRVRQRPRATSPPSESGSTGTRRAPISVSRCDSASPAPITTTSRSPIGPSESRARGILRSTSMARPSVLAKSGSRGKGRSATAGEYTGS